MRFGNVVPGKVNVFLRPSYEIRKEFGLSVQKITLNLFQINYPEHYFKTYEMLPFRYSWEIHSYRRYYHHSRFNTYANTLFLWLCFDLLMFLWDAAGHNAAGCLVVLAARSFMRTRHSHQTLTHGYTFYRRHDRRDNAVLCIVSLSTGEQQHQMNVGDIDGGYEG